MCALIRYTMNLLQIVYSFVLEQLDTLLLRIRAADSGVFNPLSKEGGGGWVTFLLRFPYGPFTHPLSRYQGIYENNFQKFLP